MKIIEKYTQTSLVGRILCGMLIGAALGLLLPGWQWLGLLGTLFVGGLKALAPILVAVLVMASIAKASSGLGKRFRKVIVLYLGASFLAATVAASASFLFPVTLSLEGAAEAQAPGSISEVFATLLSNLVMNPVQAVAQANYIGILFWAVIIGLALKATAGETTLRVVGDIADAFTAAIGWVIQFAPFGILGLVFTSVAEGGLNVFGTYGKLLALLVGCMLAVCLVVNPLIHFILLGRNPYPLLWQCLKESGVNAFFTRSSAANIPINLNLCRRIGLDSDFYGVSIPLGATVNMSGAAVTITVLSLAVVNTLGLEVSFGSAIILCILATLGACGTSGVAGGSLLLVPMACSFFGISADIAMQAVAIGFIIGVVQDSVETALNSSSDVFFTATAEYMDRK